MKTQSVHLALESGTRILALHSQACVLAIDLGTSGPKVAVVSESGDVLSAAFRTVTSMHTADGGVEQDPEAVWRAVVSASHEALRESGVAAENILAVICDSHFSSLVCLDRDGKPLMNLMVWLDQRGAHDQLAKFSGYRRDSLWRQFQWWRIHGIPPLPSGVDNVSKMRWIKFARPEVYEKTAVFLEPMDYLAHRMTGRATANACSAFMMQFTDNRKLDSVCYDPRLIRYAGIDPEKLPELVPTDAVVGKLLPAIAAELGLSPKTQVITGLNDTQAGAMGCGAFQGDHAGIALGSSGVLVTHAAKKKTDVRTSLFSMPSPVPNTYFMTGEGGVAGRALEHFVESLIFADDSFGTTKPADPYARLEEVAAASPPGANGVLFLPWINGSLAPVTDGTMRGGFLNVTLRTRRVDLARAVLEGIAYQFAQLSRAANTFTGRSFGHYTLYGGGALSPTWSQIIADILQTPVHRMARPRLVNCTGLGMLAFQRLGRVGYDEIARRVPIEKIHEPNPALRALYEEKGALLESAFKRNRPLFRQMNRKTANETENSIDD